MMDTKTYERYQRQMLLKEFGESGQQKLLQAKVLVIGAGGLGCPVLSYLAAAGVGTIGIVDHDVVSLSNLHRQVLYSTNDIGLSKAARAAVVLQQLNPGISLVPYETQINVENAIGLIRPYDVIVDGTDNFATRYLINDACVLLGKPLVYGAISQFEGQVSVFRNGAKEDVNYRDLFPEPPKDDDVLNCAEAGVLGILPGIIGTMQANETIKLITSMGEPLVNRLLTYNALNNQVYELHLSAAATTRSLLPANEEAFRQMDYQWLCSSSPGSFEIDADEFEAMLENNIAVIDVREPHELPLAEEFEHRRIPMQQLAMAAGSITGDTIVLFCQSGKRSKQAALMLSEMLGPSRKVYSLSGGIENWIQYQLERS